MEIWKRKRFFLDFNEQTGKAYRKKVLKYWFNQGRELLQHFPWKKLTGRYMFHDWSWFYHKKRDVVPRNLVFSFNFSALKFFLFVDLIQARKYNIFSEIFFEWVKMGVTIVDELWNKICIWKTMIEVCYSYRL